MIILLFGVSNVGKTTIGELFSERLHYQFLDLDLEIIKYFNKSLEEFQKDNPIHYERAKVKGEVLKYLIDKYKNNTVIAVSPIFYASIINGFIYKENIVSIELQDSAEHIFDRLVFSDENDNLYEDDEYKHKHRDYFLKDINEDIKFCRSVFEKIENKFYINNQQPNVVVDELMQFMKSINVF